MVDFATIQVHRDTKDQLAALRLPGESYDAALKRMLAEDVKRREVAFFEELDAMAADEDAFEPWE